MVDAARVVCFTCNPRRSRGNGAVHHSAALLPSVMMAEDTLTITTNSQPTKNAPRPQLQLSRASQIKIAAEAVTEEASLDGTILYLAQGGRLLPGNEADARTQFFNICQDVYKKAGFGDLSPGQSNCLMNVFPIIVGLFVGDGWSVKAAIATNKEDLDQGIQKVLEEFTGNFHLKLVAKADKRKGKHEGTCTIDFVPKTEGGSNFLWLLLQKLEFVGGGDRSFPTATLNMFLSLSRGFQLCVLAGAMAADGHVVVKENGRALYIITQGMLMRKRDDPTNLYRSHLQIAYALSKLAESLGLGGGMSFVENLGNGVIMVMMAGAIVEDLRSILQGFMPRKAAQRAPFKRMPRAANLRTVGSTDPATQGVVHGGKVLVGIPQTSEGPVRVLQTADGYFIFLDRLREQFPGGANLRQLVSWADTANAAHCKAAHELTFPNDIREDDSVVQKKRKRRNKDRSVGKSAADDVPPKRVFMHYAVPNKFGGYDDPLLLAMYNRGSEVYTEEENESMYAARSYPGYYL